METRLSKEAEAPLELKEWPTRQIALLVFPGVHLMGLAGPLEVFTRASTTLSNIGQRRSAAYQVQVLTEEETPLPTGSGLSVIGGVRWTKADKPIDTLFVLASTNVIDSQINPELLAWIRTQAETIRRVGAVSAGAFVLAAAGILDGRQVTTHWDDALDGAFDEDDAGALRRAEENSSATPGVRSSS